MREDDRLPPFEGSQLKTLRALQSLIRVLPNRSYPCQTCETEPDVEHSHFLADEQIIVDPYTDIPNLTFAKCSVCGRKDTRLYSCSLCHKGHYCGKSCQVSNWSRHSLSCLKSDNSRINNYYQSNGCETALKKHDASFDSSPKVQDNAKLAFVPRVIQINQKNHNCYDTVDRTGERSGASDSTKPFVTAKNDGVKIDAIVANSVEKTKPEPGLIPDTHEIKTPQERSDCSLIKTSKDQLPGQTMKSSSVDVDSKTSKDQSPNEPSISSAITEKNEQVINSERGILKIGAMNSVIISSFDDPHDFYVQQKEDYPFLSKITTRLTDMCANLDRWARSKELNVGELVAAMFDDKSWYRGRISSVTVGSSTKYQVHFVDYGNSSKVSYKYVQELPNDLKNIAPMAVKCSLHAINPVSGDSWTNSDLEKIENLLGDHGKYSRCKVYSFLDGVYKVDLYDEGETISWRDEIIKEKLGRDLSQGSSANTINTGESSHKTIPQDLQDQNRSTICTKDPWVIWEVKHHLTFERLKGEKTLVLSREKFAGPIIYVLTDVNKMSCLFNADCDYEKLAEVSTCAPGTVAFCFSKDDDEYVRVIVTKNLGNNISQVYHLDYGFVREVDNSSLKVLPDVVSLQKFPALAVRCYVENSEEFDGFEKVIDDKINRNRPISFEIVSPIEDGFYKIKILKKK